MRRLSGQEIVDRRGDAAVRWRTFASELCRLDPQVPSDMPAYFCDRYAYELLKRRGRRGQLDFGFGMTDILEREARLRHFVKPSLPLGGWVAQLDALTDVSAFYDHLRGLWRLFVLASGLPDSLAFLPDAQSMTWRDVFSDTVFYPRRPAIPGPTFLDVLSPREVAALNYFGQSAAIDFFCFMQQVHERIHRHQAGEPLLNEIVQAALWVRFLDRHPDLWRFQRSGTSGQSAVRELAYVRRLPRLGLAIDCIGLDTAALVARRRASRTYSELCRLARSFYAGRQDYESYLTKATILLQPSFSDARCL